MKSRFTQLLLPGAAALMLVASCSPKAENGEAVVKDIAGEWQVDSVLNLRYPSDSLVATYYSDSLIQKVTFDNNLYLTTVCEKGDTVVDMKLVYRMVGDTIKYEDKDGKVFYEEVITQYTDSTMVTAGVVMYEDRTADRNTSYYSRVKAPKACSEVATPTEVK